MPLSVVLSPQTLDKVMQLFWEKGFAATSIDEVVKLTRLNRAAIYKHFGGKEGLYTAMLKRYVNQVTTQLVAPLANLADNPLSLLQQFFLQFTKPMGVPIQQKGCFLVISATDLSFKSDAINEIINDFLTQLQAQFYQLLSQAIDQGFCRSTVNCQQTTSFLLGNIMGVMTLLRAQAPKQLVDEHIAGIDAYFENLKQKEY